MTILYVNQAGNTAPCDMEETCVRMLSTSNEKMRMLENMDGRLQIHNRYVHFTTTLGTMSTMAEYASYDLHTGIITIQTLRSEYIFKV